MCVLLIVFALQFPPQTIYVLFLISLTVTRHFQRQHAAAISVRTNTATMWNFVWFYFIFQLFSFTQVQNESWWFGPKMIKKSQAIELKGLPNWTKVLLNIQHHYTSCARLYLASWNLSDFQFCLESKTEPEWKKKYIGGGHWTKKMYKLS